MVLSGFQVFFGCYWVVLGFPWFYWISPWFYWFLPGFTGFSTIFFVLSGVTEFYWVLQGFPWFYWILALVLLVFTGFYRVLLGFTAFTEFYRVLFSFTELFGVLTVFVGLLLRIQLRFPIGRRWSWRWRRRRRRTGAAPRRRPTPASARRSWVGAWAASGWPATSSRKATPNRRATPDHAPPGSPGPAGSEIKEHYPGFPLCFFFTEFFFCFFLSGWSNKEIFRGWTLRPHVFFVCYLLLTTYYLLPSFIYIWFNLSFWDIELFLLLTSSVSLGIE